MLVKATYNKQGQESLEVDGRVTKLWTVFFKPGSGYTDRLGVDIPMGSTLDEVMFLLLLRHHHADKKIVACCIL